MFNNFRKLSAVLAIVAVAAFAFVAVAQEAAVFDNFILFQEATTDEVVEHFGISNRPSTITEDELAYLGNFLTTGQLRDIAVFIHNVGPIETLSDLTGNAPSGADLGGQVVAVLLKFYDLTDDTE